MLFELINIFEWSYWCIDRIPQNWTFVFNTKLSNLSDQYIMHHLDSLHTSFYAAWHQCTCWMTVLQSLPLVASDICGPLVPGHCQYQEPRPRWWRGVSWSHVQSSGTVYQPPCNPAICSSLPIDVRSISEGLLVRLTDSMSEDYLWHALQIYLLSLSSSSSIKSFIFTI